MKYPIYEKYKPSGIDWIGEIPDGWETRRLKSFIPKISNGQWGAEEKGNSFDWIVLRVADFSERYFVLDKNLTIRNVKDIKNKLSDGDLVIEKSGGGEKQLVGRVVQFKQKDDHKYTYSNFIGKLVIEEEISKDYLFYYFKTFYECRINFKHIKQTTGIQNLDSDSLLQSEFFSLPLIENQIKIAKYLDEKTARIDRLIKKDKKLIELLKEERIALINKVVTKGLEDNVKMKDSGIDWIGEIPEEWLIEKLKHLVAGKITDGPHETPELLNEGISFISAEAVKGDRLNFELRRGFISEKDHKKFCVKCKPKRNDILFIKSGATTGNVAMVENDDEFSIWSPLAVIRMSNVIIPRLMFYNLLSDYFKKQVELSWSFGTQENIGMGVIQNLVVPVPPLPIQNEIIEYLDIKTNKIDKVIQKVARKITLLEEYKRSLTYNVVTGKMKV